MKILFDLFPVILFFVSYQKFGIFTATAVAIIATLALIIYSHLRHGKIEKMLLINGVIITVLGSITLLLHDKTYIMWKPTVLYWLGAIALWVSQQFFGKNLIAQMMQKMLAPPAAVWQKLNWLWIIFLLALGKLNLYVAFNYSESAWVKFKLFGVSSILFIFVMLQIVLLRKYLIEPSETDTKN